VSRTELRDKDDDVQGHRDTEGTETSTEELESSDRLILGSVDLNLLIDRAWSLDRDALISVRPLCSLSLCGRYVNTTRTERDSNC
jgi:hypothetical protein